MNCLILLLLLLCCNNSGGGLEGSDYGCEHNHNHDHNDCADNEREFYSYENRRDSYARRDSYDKRDIFDRNDRYENECCNNQWNGYQNNRETCKCEEKPVS